MKALHTLVIVAGLLASAGSFAQQAAPSGDHASHHSEEVAGKPQSEGEVRKVDIARGKITLRHGPLANLEMPAMTMIFTATDPKLLEGLKEGDKVRFTADKRDGAYFVSAIERAE